MSEERRQHIWEGPQGIDAWIEHVFVFEEYRIACHTVRETPVAELRNKNLCLVGDDLLDLETRM